MLPIKIKKFLNYLYLKTENDEFKWSYNDNLDKVTLSADDFEISITYYFDEMEEIGRYKVRIYKDGKEYWYSTSQQHSDFDDVRKLYDSAQSSDMGIVPNLRF